MYREMDKLVFIVSILYDTFQDLSFFARVLAADNETMSQQFSKFCLRLVFVMYDVVLVIVTSCI